MSYTIKHLDREQQDQIIAETKASPAEAPGDALLIAWEADLLAHRTRVKTATGEDKERHNEAIKVLEDALTEAAKI